MSLLAQIRAAMARHRLEIERILASHQPPDTTPPSVTLTASAIAFTQPDTLTLTATPVGTVARVEYLRDGIKIGESFTAPHTFPVTISGSGQAGNYTARAVKLGAPPGTSAPLGITVDIDSAAPTVTLTASPSTVIVDGTVTLTASPSDNKGVASVTVSGPGGTLGTLTAPPWTFPDPANLTAADNGTRTYSATVTDTSGLTGSATRSVTVAIAADPADPLYVEPDPATIAWGPPVVLDNTYLDSRGIVPLTSGPHAGRYPVSGLTARNLVTGDCALWVNTTRPLLIRHSTFSGVHGSGTGRSTIGNGKYGASLGNSVNVDVVIEDCTVITPGLAMSNGQRAGGVLFGYAKNVAVLNNNFIGCAGVLVAELVPGGSGGTVKVERNKFRNIDGRYRDTASPTGFSQATYPTGWAIAQAAQLDKVRGLAGISISDNDVLNVPGQSQVEDVINTFKSGGTAASPLKIYRNLIDGAYDSVPTNVHSGSGVMMGDAGGDRSEATFNTVVRTSNTGISMAAMNYGRIQSNFIMQTGFDPNGNRVDGNGANIDAGIFARNFSEGSGFVMDKATNFIGDNDVAWGAPSAADPTRRNDFFFSAYATEGPLPNRDAGPPTDAKIADAIAAHRAVWASAGVIVGRRKP